MFAAQTVEANSMSPLGVETNFDLNYAVPGSVSIVATPVYEIPVTVLVNYEVMSLIQPFSYTFEVRQSDKTGKTKCTATALMINNYPAQKREAIVLLNTSQANFI